MTGPSAMGSEKGTPSSIKSTPPRSSAATSAAVRSGAGSPAVMYPISPGRPSCLSRSKSRLMRVTIEFLDVFSVDVSIFVASPGKVHNEDLVFGGGRAIDRFRNGVRRFERRNQTFRPGEELRGIESAL